MTSPHGKWELSDMRAAGQLAALEKFAADTAAVNEFDARISRAPIRPEEPGDGWALVLIAVAAVLGFAALVWFAPGMVAAALGATVPGDALMCIERGGCGA